MKKNLLHILSQHHRPLKTATAKKGSHPKLLGMKKIVLHISSQHHWPLKTATAKNLNKPQRYFKQEYMRTIEQRQINLTLG
jgi:hypothetical protein